jgi:hypothetical protein
MVAIATTQALQAAIVAQVINYLMEFWYLDMTFIFLLGYITKNKHIMKLSFNQCQKYIF